METTLLIVILSSAGLVLSSFFGLYLVSTPQWRSFANTLLGLLLIVLSLRIGKAIFYNFVELPLFFKNLGLAANLAVGPLLYLYGKALLFKEFKWKLRLLLHFLPTMIYVGFCWRIPNATGDLFWNISYSLVLLQSYTYVFLSLRTFYQRREHNHRLVNSWYRNLTLGLLGMWLVYGLIFIQVLPYHIAGAISFSLLMVILAFMAFNQGLVFKGDIPIKYQNSNLSDADARKYQVLIKQAVEGRKLYLESDLTVKRLSEILDVHPKSISETINRCEGQNFTRFINTYRVDEAKKLLHDKRTNHKIIAVAYNCGFNSLSAFNFVFKKITSYTPSEFRALL
ncbi:MAG: helix-turn-helix transcriptional regulator [Saonia sp.]